MRVLVIDDEPDVRHVVTLSLGRVGGMCVLEASCGAEGVALARRERPDLILLDVMMPGMDGTTTFGALRADAATAAVPVVFLTAKAATSDVQRLASLGARGVVLKPFDPMTLPHQIRSILHGE